jgi:hypothetical protein
MSLTVDDLVSSLSSSHIGQEAIELAALQEYLRQTGFGKPGAATCPSPSFASPPSTSRQTLDQLCNTPISQNTPVQSSMAQYAWTERNDGNSMTMNGEGGDSSTCSALFAGGDDYSDEAMVEDLLIPSSPPPSSAFPHTRLRSSSSSSFASSDPFYLAQTQAQLQATSTNWSEIQHSSFYSQQLSHGHTHNSGAFFATSSTPGSGYSDSSLNMPGPMNPGYGQQQYEYYHQGHQQHRPPLAIDTHRMLVETCAAFAS